MQLIRYLAEIVCRFEVTLSRFWGLAVGRIVVGVARLELAQ
jgi:hypothetical protein